MRIVPFIVSAAVTTGLIVALSIKIGSNPPIGQLLSPSHGFWKNAEYADGSFSLDITSPELQDSVSVFLDERLVPHVFAQNDHDLYFVQGWLHAKFRLWQMEFQTYAAAGRLCEIFGERVGSNSVLEGHDRRFRRMGMVFAAENALKAIKEDTVAQQAVDAYTAGANAYISKLEPEEYPIEYKLLDYAPEGWTALKTALMFKYMSYDLTADLDDFEYTNVLNALGLNTYEQLYPLQADSVKPIVPKGTVYTATRPLPVKPANADSLYLYDTSAIAITTTKPDPDNGSNNWVIAGRKTAGGKPILCNDPHLGLNLPSLWFEMQLHTPQNNVYGVSLPGVPSIIIGFNDSIAWGMTNAARDVMDFYEIKFRDSTMNEYWYDSNWVKTEWRTEMIHISGKADFADKIAMTIWGPVMYDATYQSSLKDGKAYAIKWTAHEPSAEVAVSMNLNRAHNYPDFINALKSHSNPGQNFVFASKTNDIAFSQLGTYPAKWKHQGDFVMPGWDSSFRWQGYIPFEDKINQFNPGFGFVSSANQMPADTNYPYYLGGSYDVYRGFIVKRMLHAKDSGFTIDDMQQMQTDNYNVFARMARPVFLKYIIENELSANAKTLLVKFKEWNLRADADENGMTIFNEWWNRFRDTVWLDDITLKNQAPTPMPADQTLLEGILRDSAFRFVDNINTPETETLPVMITAALNKAAENIGADLKNWSVAKDTRITHLLKIPAFTRMHLNIGGGGKMINATKTDHGPSWRMIVQLTDVTEAYGVYPGGQSGNPGSKYYDQFVDQWVAGKYYRLWVMNDEDVTSKKVKWLINFKKG